ncbi:MAG TPA: beta-ketoacyl synthase N-terminal-like domain-containing protein, partial [bacterium]|nr:beta-ketoacyl synthase N-terminal-like domain-containing protein [bacterium]
MSDPKPRAVISAVGMVTAAGSGMRAFADALARGELLAKPATLLDTSGFPAPAVCEVPGLDPRALARVPKDAKMLARSAVLSLGALADLRAGTPGALFGDPWRSGLFLGVGMEQGDHRDVLSMLTVSRGRKTSLLLSKIAAYGMGAMNPIASLKTLPNMSLAHVGIKLGDEAPRGANAAYSPFDAAPLEALGAAAAAVWSGECEAALAGGVDAPISLFGMTTFHRLGVASATRPMGEAAALFLVEPPERAALAGRTPLALIEGWGSASDGAPTARPRTTTLAAAVTDALSWHGMTAASIDSVSLSAGDPLPDAHALGGEGLARAEVAVPRRVFGEAVAGSGALAIAGALSQIARGRKRALAVAG